MSNVYRLEDDRDSQSWCGLRYVTQIHSKNLPKCYALLGEIKKDFFFIIQKLLLITLTLRLSVSGLESEVRHLLTAI